MRRREFLRASLSAAAAMAAPQPALWAGTAAHRQVLYLLEEGTSAAAMRAAVIALGPSRFNVLILSFLQADYGAEKLTLSYNGNAPAELPAELPALLARLRTGFAQRKKILLSIGGWDHLATFEAIRSAGVPAFVGQLTDEIVQPLGLDGIDLDLEPNIGGLDHWRAAHAEYGHTLAELTNEYKRVHPGHVVTHAPLSVIAAELYAQPAPLPALAGGLLHATRTAHGNNVDWLNVQFYEGGLVPNGDIAGFYCERLVEPLQKITRHTGIADPVQFLLPLLEPQAGQGLELCRKTIHAMHARCGELPGGIALWDYRQIRAALPAWSTGLSGVLEAGGRP